VCVQLPLQETIRVNVSQLVQQALGRLDQQLWHCQWDHEETEERRQPVSRPADRLLWMNGMIGACTAPLTLALYKKLATKQEKQ